MTDKADPPSVDGWMPDPFGLHETRYFSQGKPTKLVRDGDVESYDDPPAGISRGDVRSQPGRRNSLAEPSPETQRSSPPADSGPQAVTEKPRGIAVSGPVIGSRLVLWFVLTAGASGMALALGASKGQSMVTVLIGIAIAMGVMSALSARMMTVSVDSGGFELRMTGMSQMALTVEWDDVVEIKSGRLGGAVVLQSPIQWGLRASRKVQFAVLDPRWSKRTTSVAILAGVASRRSAAAHASDRRRGPPATRTRRWRVVIRLSALFFGIGAVTSLAHLHYVSTVWYAIPMVAALLLQTAPAVVVSVRKTDSATRATATSSSWRREIGAASFLMWMLVGPMAYVLKHTMHHRHDLSSVLAFAGPAVLSTGVFVLLRRRMKNSV